MPPCTTGTVKSVSDNVSDGHRFGDVVSLTLDAQAAGEFCVPGHLVMMMMRRRRTVVSELAVSLSEGQQTKRVYRSVVVFPLWSA